MPWPRPPQPSNVLNHKCVSPNVVMFLAVGQKHNHRKARPAGSHTYERATSHKKDRSARVSADSRNARRPKPESTTNESGATHMMGGMGGPGRLLNSEVQKPKNI